MLTPAKTKRDPFFKQKRKVTRKQQSTKSSVKDVNLGTIIDTLSWHKFSPLNGIRVTPKLHKRRRRIHERSQKPSQNPKVIHTAIFWNLASLVKSYDGVIELLHLINQRQTKLQDELHVKKKNRHQRYYCNLDWITSGGQILWNAITICRMAKTSWQTGNLKMNGDLENPSGTCFARGRIWREDILTAEIEELE